MRSALAKRAHPSGCALFVLLAAVFPALLLAAPCPLPVVDEYATVRYVHDGDTLHLSDGRKIRLIGINTPELGRDGLPAEPYAAEARQFVRQQLPVGHRIGLIYGVERYDSYGRMLAHIVLGDGQSLNQRMLERGYAQYIAVPPNLRLLDCYRQAEQQARKEKLGVWQQEYHRVLHRENVSGKERGFHIVRGRIIRVGESKKHIWLNLDGPIALRIRRSDLHYFTVSDWSSLRGREVEARGWIHQHKDQLQLGIQHPAGLVYLDK